MIRHVDISCATSSVRGKMTFAKLRLDSSYYSFISIVLRHPYLSGTAGLYNQVHTDTGSRWPDLHRYRHSDRGHWHTRLCLRERNWSTKNFASALFSTIFNRWYHCRSSLGWHIVFQHLVLNYIHNGDHSKASIVWCVVVLFFDLSDTAGLHNQAHCDTGSRWPDLCRYHCSDRMHWHTRLRLKITTDFLV